MVHTQIGRNPFARITPYIVRVGRLELPVYSTPIEAQIKGIVSAGTRTVTPWHLVPCVAIRCRIDLRLRIDLIDCPLPLCTPPPFIYSHYAP